MFQNSQFLTCGTVEWRYSTMVSDAGSAARPSGFKFFLLIPGNRSPSATCLMPRHL